jgi:hypothetical protein
MEFSANDEWIALAFVELNEHLQKLRTSHIGYQSLDWIVPMLMHDGFASTECYLENRRIVLASGGGKALAPKLWSAARAGTLESVTGHLRKAIGFEGRRRTRSTRILTPNVYSHTFEPPSAKGLTRTLSALFRARSHYLQTPCALGPVLATYLVLLTIHPLQDGNGRTARLLFAADVVSRFPQSGSVLLALVLLTSHRGERFHMAAKIARSGDFHMLASWFIDALQHAERSFAPKLRELESAVEAGGLGEAEALALHAALTPEMKGMLWGKGMSFAR